MTEDAESKVDPVVARRDARRLALGIGITVLLAGGLGFGACWVTRGSSEVAEKWVADIRGNHLDEAMPVLTTDAHVGDPETTKALELVRTGKGDVSSGVRGFGHNGLWVPYACNTVDDRVWLVMMKIDEKWRIVEIRTTQPKACESD